MNTQQRDPLFESLDRLAGIADTDLVGDRMPDIQRRVRVARQRKSAGLVAAAAVLAVGGVGVWDAYRPSARHRRSPTRVVPPPGSRSPSTSSLRAATTCGSASR